MINIDIDFFKEVLAMGIINEEQFEMIKKYLDNPKSQWRIFKEKPDF